MAKHKPTTSKIPEKVQRQNEEKARLEAERLTSPRESEAPAGGKTEEPSLEQRLADIERRGRERVAQEKAALAGHYLAEAEAKFKRLLSNTSDEALKTSYEEVLRLRKLSGGGSAVSGDLFGGVVESGGGGTGKRTRRNPDEAKADAQKLADYIKENPGTKGPAAVAAVGIEIKAPLNAGTFIERYLPSVKLKREGTGAATTYTIH
jgi:hypothetical protein